MNRPQTDPDSDLYSLMKAFNFDKSDLKRNGEGEMTDHQVKMLLNIHYQNILSLIAIFMFPLCMLSCVGSWARYLLCFVVVLLILIYPVVTLITRILNLSQDIREKEVYKIAGEVRTDKISSRVGPQTLLIEGGEFKLAPDGNGKNYFKLHSLTEEAVKFKLSATQILRFRHLENYDLYYTPHARIILAATPHENLQRDKAHILQRILKIFRCGEEELEQNRQGKLADKQHRLLRQARFHGLGFVLAGLFIWGLCIVLLINTLIRQGIGQTTEENISTLGIAIIIGISGWFFLSKPIKELWLHNQLINDDLATKAIKRAKGQINMDFVRGHQGIVLEYRARIGSARVRLNEQTVRPFINGKSYVVYYTPMSRIVVLAEPPNYLEETQNANKPDH